MVGRRGQLSGYQWRQMTSRIKGIVGRSSISGFALALCILSLWSQLAQHSLKSESQIDVDLLWGTSPSFGWRASSMPRSPDWLLVPGKQNGYIMVHCKGGLSQQRHCISNAALVARIMNAALVLPELDRSPWGDMSTFSGVYDVDHFIRSLKHDIKVVKALPKLYESGNKTNRPKTLKPFQIRPPRDASPVWYGTVALEKIKEHGALYIAPFSHHLDEELENPEYQRLRCRVNFHALRFRKEVMELSSKIVRRLRSEGQFLAIQLSFGMDLLAFSGCLDIFTPSEQEILREYRQQKFGVKTLVADDNRSSGKCPLTPEEVGLILHAIGVGNSTQIYISSGDIFGGDLALKTLRGLFPRLKNQSTVLRTEELAVINSEGGDLLVPAVDYMVCLLADIFLPNYVVPNNFANMLFGHRLYYGFRTTIKPVRKVLVSFLMERGKGNSRNFEQNVRTAVKTTWFRGPQPRVPPELFLTNPWPECFCKPVTEDPTNQCPSNLDLFESRDATGEDEDLSF